MVICTPALRSAMCDPRAIGWRWTLIAGFARQSIWSFASSTRSAAFARSQYGYDRKASSFPRFVHGEEGRAIAWHLPRYNSVHRILTNPVYAGAYVFGRTVSQVRVEAGRKVVKTGVRRRQEEWSVLIRDHHAGYVTWDQYERNQRLIGDNANMKGAMVPGSVRNGGGLLVGLLRCGHCGRKLTVQHNGLRGVARYLCNGASVNHGARDKCITFGNMRIDAAVSAEVLRAISPLAIEAAIAACRRARTGQHRPYRSA